MDGPVVQDIHQVGLYAPGPERLAVFYPDLLGLQIVAQSKLNPDGVRSTIFLSSRPTEESYQVALFASPELSHTAFQASTLADLRTFYQQAMTKICQFAGRLITVWRWLFISPIRPAT